MSETTGSNKEPSNSRPSLTPVGIGALLFGLASVVFAFAFSAQRFASDTSFPKQDLGYQIVFHDGASYLLDKDNGYIWERKKRYETSPDSAWCIAHVQNLDSKKELPYTSSTDSRAQICK